MALVRQCSRELEDAERRELAVVLRQCRRVLTPGEGEGEVDLDAVGVRVHAVQRGDYYLYTVSQVLVADLKNYVMEGHILLKAGDTVVSSFAPRELHEFCHTQLTSSSVRLVFGSTDALREDAEGCCDDVDYVALKVGIEAVEQITLLSVGELGSSVGSVPSRHCCTLPLDNFCRRRCVVKLDSYYLNCEPEDLRLHKSESSYLFEVQSGFLEEATSILISTLETEVGGRRMALRYEDPSHQNDCLSLELAPFPSGASWASNKTSEKRRVISRDCKFFFRFSVSSDSNLYEIRPLHYQDFFLCLNDGGVLVGKRDGSSADIFDIQYRDRNDINSISGSEPDLLIMDEPPIVRQPLRSNSSSTHMPSGLSLWRGSDDLSPSSSTGDLSLGPSFLTLQGLRSRPRSNIF